MDYHEVLTNLAPCGLDCSRCADYQKGEIKELSSKLLKLLGDYERLAKIKSEKKPEFAGYAQFKEILTVFSEAACGGCRSENCLCPITCVTKTCHKEKGVDFCFQCVEYPCQRQHNPILRKRWMQNNNRMKEVGVVRFYEEQVKAPRY